MTQTLERLGRDCPVPKGVHPAAAFFPQIEGDEFEKLVTSIHECGLDHEIVVDREGRVLDGRNRLRACEMAGVEPRFTRYEGDDPIDFVRRQNLRRRDLTPGQKAAIEASLSEMDAKARAKDRQRASGGGSGRGGGDIRTVSPRGDEPLEPAASRSRRASAEMADRAGVGRNTMERTLRVKREDPELFDKIRGGEVTPRAAEHELLKRQTTEAEKAKNHPDRARQRERRLAEMAEAGYTSRQIAKELDVGLSSVGTIASRIGVTIHADKAVGRTRTHDATQILNETVSTLEAVAMSLSLIDIAELNGQQIHHWITSLTASLRSINRFAKQLKEVTP
jgi:ParB-like chromosome segregation protein Spo0J